MKFETLPFDYFKIDETNHHVIFDNSVYSVKGSPELYSIGGKGRKAIKFESILVATGEKQYLSNLSSKDT